MIERSVTAAVLFAWVAGDEVYGDNGRCAPGWKPSASPMCLQSPAITGYRPGRARPPRRSARRAAAPAGLAAVVRRGRRQRTPMVRLGMGHHQRSRPGVPVPADPPEPQHRGTGLLPLPQPPPGHAGRPGEGGRAQVGHRDRPPLVPVKLRCFLMVALLRCGRFPVGAVPSGRGCRSRAGVPGVRVAGISAVRLR